MPEISEKELSLFFVTGVIIIFLAILLGNIARKIVTRSGSVGWIVMLFIFLYIVFLLVLMKKKLSSSTQDVLTNLVFVTIMSGLMFLLSIFSINGLKYIPGNSFDPFFTTSLIQIIIITITILIIRSFGIATSMFFIFGVLSTMTGMMPNLAGPLKIFIAILMGLILDSMARLGNFKISSLFFAPLIMYLIVIPFFIWLHIKMNLPGTESLIEKAPILLIITIVESLIGVFIGVTIYNKIKDKEIIKLIEG